MKSIFYIIALFFFLTGLTPLSAEDTTNKKQTKVNKKKHKRNNSPIARIMAKLTDQEKEKLKALQKKDQVAFQAELKTLADKYNLKYSPISKEILEIVNLFHKAESEEQKKEILANLSEVVKKEFNEQMETNRKNYEKAAKRLEELKKKMEEKQARSDKIISQRVKYLTKQTKIK